MSVDRSAESLAYVRDALARTPRVLEEALAPSLPADPGSAARIVTTGLGASEGPARLLASRLAAVGRPARFEAASSVGSGSVGGDVLVVFSQALSPNARHALSRAHRFGAVWLVTARDDARGPLPALPAHVTVLPFPTPRERGTLVRLIGPTVASLASLRLAGALGDPDASPAALARAPAAYARAATSAAEPFDRTRPIALVTAGLPTDALFGARWSLMEALLVPDPPTWDALAYAHGPLQASMTTPLSIVLVRTDAARTLADTFLASVPDEHRVSAITIAEPVLGSLELAGYVAARLRATLETHGGDLFAWPGRERESPLYRVGADEG